MNFPQLLPSGRILECNVSRNAKSQEGESLGDQNNYKFVSIPWIRTPKQPKHAQNNRERG